MDRAKRTGLMRPGRAASASLLIAALGLGQRPPGLAFPAVFLVSPARAAEAPAAVVLDHLSFRRGRLTVAIPHVEARGTSLTGPELREVLDPSSPLGVAQRLTRLSAASFAAPEVTFGLDPKPGEASGQSVTLHDVLLSDVRAGKAATLSIRSVDGTVRSGAAERDTIAVGAITAHAVDPQLALAIATGSRTDREFPASPVYGDIAAMDLKLKTDGAEVLSIDRLESGAFEGRPLLDTPAHLLRSLEEAPGLVPPIDKSRFYDTLLDAAAGFKLDRFLISGLSFESGREPKNAFKIRTVLLRGLEAFKLGLFEINDTALDAGDIHLSMRSASLSNVDRSALLGTAMARLMGLSPMLGDASKPEGSGGAEFKVTDAHMAFPTTDADAPFPLGTVNVVDLPVIESGESASAGGSAVEAHAHVEVRYDIPPVGTDHTIQQMRDMGLAHLDVGFGYRILYDAVKREARLEDLALDGKDIGRVALSGRIADLPDAPLQQGLTPDEATARLAAATFRDLTLTLVDRGFLGRALPVLAREAGTSPALLRAGLKTKVDLGLPDLLGQTPAEAAVARAIDAFIDGAGTLVLSARAPNGLPLRDVGATADPAALAQRLDITAETHR